MESTNDCKQENTKVLLWWSIYAQYIFIIWFSGNALIYLFIFYYQSSNPCTYICINFVKKFFIFSKSVIQRNQRLKRKSQCHNWKLKCDKHYRNGNMFLLAMIELSQTHKHLHNKKNVTSPKWNHDIGKHVTYFHHGTCHSAIIKTCFFIDNIEECLYL